MCLLATKVYCQKISVALKHLSSSRESCLITHLGLCTVLFLVVCPETEESLYTDKFFESQDLIVNALDNVEARRYMDR